MHELCTYFSGKYLMQDLYINSYKLLHSCNLNQSHLNNLSGNDFAHNYIYMLSNYATVQLIIQEYDDAIAILCVNCRNYSSIP